MKEKFCIFIQISLKFVAINPSEIYINFVRDAVNSYYFRLIFKDF